MRENLLPPLYDAKCLRVTIMNPLNHSVVDVVDSLLWISPQLDSLYFGCGTEDLKTLKVRFLAPLFFMCGFLAVSSLFYMPLISFLFSFFCDKTFILGLRSFVYLIVQL